MDIYIEEGVIAEIGRNLSVKTADILDVGKRHILPGLIDMHCNVCDPGYETKEDIRTASKSAAKGGFTSITCQPMTMPVIDNKTVVNYLLTNARQQSMVHLYPYGSMTIGGRGEQMAEIGEMIKAGVAAVSNNDQYAEDAALLRNVLTYSRMFDIPVITVCNDPGLAGDGVINHGLLSVKVGLKGIPREAEETIVARNILLAKYTHARLHIAKISTRGSVELIRSGKRQGVDITCETCPQYFTLTEDAVDTYNTKAKVKPPLRTQDDVDGIIEGLLDDTIDVISSGHSPDTVESVNVEFDRASYAVSTLESAFVSAYTALVATSVMPLERLVYKMSQKPAEILRIPNKGRIAEGYDGDLFIVDSNCEYMLDASQFASKAKFSPYDGMTMQCRINGAIVDGDIVYLDDELYQ